jgi:hypothetical protein
LPWDGDLGHLEGDVATVAHDLRADLDQLQVLKELADVYFASAKTIVLVQDNLNIHSKASLYEAFPAAEARRLAACVRSLDRNLPSDFDDLIVG